MAASSSHLRITPIDSLRGIAALAVANYHFHPFSQDPPEGGYLCVDLFFLLSGIVLTHVYEHRITQDQINFRHFFLNRMARLYPLHLITFLVMLGCKAIELRDEANTGWTFSMVNITLNLLLLQNVGLSTHASALNIPAWSVSTEIVVNFAWFYILILLRRTTALFSLIIIASAALLFFGRGWSYNAIYYNLYGVFNEGLLRCASGFLLGCLLYRFVLAPDRLSGLSITTLNGASFLVLAALSLLFYEHARLMPKGADYLIVLIFFPLLVLGSIHSGTFLHRFLSLSVFRYLGDISYSIYLWHWPLGTLLAHAQIHLPGIHGPIWGIAFFAGLLPLSVLSFHYLEMPLRNLLKYRSWALDS